MRFTLLRWLTWFLPLWAVVAASLLLVAYASGQTLTISVPETSEAGTLIDAKATPGHNSYLWKITKPDGQRSHQIRRTGPHGDMICWTGPPGKYLIEVISTTGDCQLMEAYTHATIQGDPNPNPQPDPSPVPGQLTAVLIHEASNPSPDPLRLAAMDRFQAYLQGQNVWTRTEDKDMVSGATGETPAWFRPYLARTQGKSLPRIVVGSFAADGSHSAVADEAFTTYDKAVEFVGRYRGEQ